MMPGDVFQRQMQQYKIPFLVDEETSDFNESLMVAFCCPHIGNQAYF
jgi:hypothetical protein